MNKFKDNIIKSIVCVLLIGISYINLMLYCLMGWSMLEWEKVTNSVTSAVLGLYYSV